MTLGPDRRRAYSFGALTGAFGALAVAGWRRRLAIALALCCGTLAVAFEERAQAADAPPGSEGADG